jgi:hypothetical protein
MSEVDSTYCTLSMAAEGRAESCPRDACAFWEPGGAVVSGGCSIERLGVDVRRDDVAAYLLELRERLAEARYLPEIQAAHRRFVRRLDRD